MGQNLSSSGNLLQNEVWAAGQRFEDQLPTFELTLTTIASVLETNPIILNADDQSRILFLNGNSNMSLAFLFLNAMVQGIFY